MKLNLMFAAALLPGVALLAQQPQTVHCSSQNNGQQQFCPANTRDGVLMVHEAPGGGCRQGSTWNYDRRGITVNNGCNADFLVSGRRDGDSGYGQNNGYNNQDNNYGQNSNGPQQQYNGGYNGNANGGYNNGPANRGNVSRNLPTIPQGTQISMQLTQDARLSDLNQGDYVAGTLVNDLNIGGTLIAPAGSQVQGKVRSAQGTTLDLRLDSLTAANGQTYTLQTTAVHSVRDAVSTPNSGRTGFGAVLGSVLDAGTLQTGTVFNFRLTADARSNGRPN